MPLWFGDLTTPLEMDTDDGLALTAWAAACLGGAPGREPFPAALRADQQPRLALVSLSDGRQPARVAVGGGPGLEAAVTSALGALRGPGWGAAEPQWLRLDLVASVLPAKADEKPSSLCLAGAAGPAGSGLVLLAEELQAGGLFDESGRLRRAATLAHLRRCPRVPAAAEQGELDLAYRFSTRSFFTGGGEPLPVVRGHRVVSELTPGGLLAAAMLGGCYLMQAVDGRGRFDYLYDPAQDRVEDDYNLVRHAGTVHAMLELYQVTADAGLRAAAERALAHLAGQARRCRLAGERVQCIVERGRVSLGGLALAALAMARHANATGLAQYVPLMLWQARAIELLARPGGELVHHASTRGRALPGECDYYPGEAMLALLRVHEINPEGKWLDLAEAVARRLIGEDRTGPAEQGAAHWLLYSLLELHRRRPAPEYLAHALRLAGAVVGNQQRDPRRPELLGSFGNRTTTNCAARMEGVAAACALARENGRAAEAEAMLAALRLGIRFVLQGQYQPETVMFLPNPARALGGFQESLTAGRVRIDYVQHAISALLGVRRLLVNGGH